MSHQKIIATFLITASVCATGAFAADGDNKANTANTPQGSSVNGSGAASKPKPHSHVEEKQGYVPPNKGNKPSDERDKSTDTSRHIHTRDR